jgi:hypothetical protein
MHMHMLYMSCGHGHGDMRIEVRDADRGHRHKVAPGASGHDSWSEDEDSLCFVLSFVIACHSGAFQPAC